MPRSQSDLCREYIQLGKEAKKKILPVAVAVYVHNLIQNERYDDAIILIENAWKKGIRNDYINKLYEYASAIRDLKILYGFAKSIIENMPYVKPDFIKSTKEKIEKIRDTLSKLGADVTTIEHVIYLLDDAYKITRFYMEAEPLFSRAADMINKFTDLLEKASGNPDLSLLQSAFAYGANNIRQVIDNINSLIRSTTTLVLHSDALSKIKQSIIDKLIRIRSVLKGIYTFSKHGLPIAGRMSALVNELKHFGEDGNILYSSPGTPTPYYNTLKDNLVVIMKHVKELENASRITEFPEEIRDNMRKFASTVVDWLNSLKKQLGENDPRFVDLFEDAESTAGYNLIDVQKPWEAIPGLEAFVRNVADAARVAFRSSDVVSRVLGAIALVGAGALDELTILLRPNTLFQQLKALHEFAETSMNRVLSKGFAGLAESASEMFNAMFGTPERALESLGGILAGVTIAIGVKKLPLPTRVKAFLVDALQGDPVGLAVDSVEAIGVKSIFRKAVSKTASGAVTIHVFPDDIDGLVAKSLREGLSEAEARHVLKISRSLAKDVAKIVRRNGLDLTKIKRVVEKAIRKYGAEALIRDANALMDTRLRLLQKLFKTEKPVDLDELVKRLRPDHIIGLDDLKKHGIRAVLKEHPLTKLLGEMTELRDTILDMKKFISKYSDMIGETTSKQLLDKLDKLLEYYSEGKYSSLANIYNDIKKFLDNEISLDQLKMRIMTGLELAGASEKPELSKLLRDVEHADSSLELINAINKHLDALTRVIDPARLQIISGLLDALKEVSKTPIGRVFKYIENRIVKDMSAKFMAVPDIPLNNAVLKTLKEIDMEAVSPETRSILNEIREKALRQKLSLMDIEKLTEKLARISPSKASKIELDAIHSLLKTIKQHLDGLLKQAIIPEDIKLKIRSLEDRIVERYRVLFPGGELDVTTAVHKAPIGLVHNLRILTRYLQDLDPKYGAKFKEIVDKFLKEYEAGTVTGETAKELFEELYSGIKKLKAVNPGFLQRLKKSIRDYVKWMDEQTGIRPEVLSSIENLADIISKDIDAMIKKLMKQGSWGVLEYSVRRETYVLNPYRMDLETFNRLRKLLSKPVEVREVQWGDIRVKMTREAHLRPDMTLEVKYRLEFPNKRVFEMYMVSRPVDTKAMRIKQYLETELRGKRTAMVDTYVRVYYDPEVLSILEQAGNPEDVIKSIIRQGDPLYDTLTRIRVLTPIGSATLEQMFNSLLTASVLALIQKPEIRRLLPRGDLEEIMDKIYEHWHTIKPPELEDIKVIAAFTDGKHNIIIGAPTNPDDLAKRLIGYVRLRYGDKTLLAPKIRYNTQEYILVTPFTVESLTEKQVDLPEQATPETPEPVGPMPKGASGVPGTPFPVPVLTDVGFKSKSGEKSGEQYEVISL